MKFKINTDKGEKDVEIKLKGRHTKSVWSKLHQATLEAKEGKEDLDKVIEYKEFIESLVCELSGLTPKELDDLDIEEKNKLTSYIEEQTRNEISFLKPS